jgi:hypothetical protein
MPKARKRSGRSGKKKRRAKKKQKLTMRKHRNLYGLNMVELVTEMFRRQLPGPGASRYQFKPRAPTRAQRRTFQPYQPYGPPADGVFF